MRLRAKYVHGFGANTGSTRENVFEFKAAIFEVELFHQSLCLGGDNTRPVPITGCIKDLFRQFASGFIGFERSLQRGVEVYCRFLSSIQLVVLLGS